MQLEGGGRPQCKGQHEGSPVEGMQVEVPGTEQGSGSPRGQKGGGDGGRQGQVAGGSICPGERPWRPHFSGWPGAHAGHLHASCGYSGEPSCVPRAGLVWLAEGPAGQKQQCWHRKGGALARGGGWLAGARSSARCRWSQGEAGSWRGIWLSCWRCTRGEREGGTRVRWVPRQG